MKRKFLKYSTLALAITALAVPVSAALLPAPSRFTTDDPVKYDSKDETLIDYDKMTIVPNKAASVSDIKKVILHYINDDNRCNSRRFYTWNDIVDDGTEQKSDESSETQMTLVMDFTTPRYSTYLGLTSMWFIIKFAGTWAGQSDDIKVDYEKYQDYITDDGLLELWLIPGEGNAIEICTNEADTKITKIATAKFVVTSTNQEWKTIHCVSSDKDLPLWYKLYAFDRVYLNSDASSQIANKEFYLLKESSNITPTSAPGAKYSEFDIKLNYTAHINVQYMIESCYPGYEDKPARKVFVSFENLYSTPRFSEHYTYSGDDLGVTYTKEKTTFKVWSPISASVDLKLYTSGIPKDKGGSDAGRVEHMFYTGNGVWEVSIAGDMLSRKDRFYNYLVTNPSGSKIEAVDPYAHAVGLNGVRGYIYDPKSDEANPVDPNEFDLSHGSWSDVPNRWDGLAGYDIKNPQDLSIYEIHIRDLTMDNSWISNKGNKRGTYNAFVEEGTTYSEKFKGTDYTVTTGFDHIKELGVKAVQLLPVFDNDNEETYELHKFNWGYNPLNYNCVEGAYSSDPTDPMARIREYKNLVRQFALGANKTRVIMDVVYNHVSSAPNSCFTKIMPKYYFRYTEDWSYTAGSGCANDVRTEAPMMRKYIVDSLKWWATEYKIKGFRFDLMGLIDVETMRQVRNALTEIDPDIYIYGEGWSSGGTRFDAGNMGTTSENIYSQLYPSASTNGYVGGFNDEGRNAIRGYNDSGWADRGNKYPTWGLVSSSKHDGAQFFDKTYDMIRGYHTSKGGNPNQMIAYASCHDNYTVWDQLRYCLATNGYKDRDEMDPNRTYDMPLRPKSGGEPDIGELVAASIMTHGLVMSSNGVAFMQGGEEIYRTKTISDVDNPAQGIEATPEYEKLTTGGDEAIIRPFPSYMNYNPANNPEDPAYNPSAPISILCTGEVKMFGEHELVSHNSYKLPDSVNSFKWDRKIHVGTDVLTYEKFAEWKAMIALRNSTSRFDFDEMKAGKADSFSTWGDYYNDGAIGIYIPNGTHLAFSSRDGGGLSIGQQTFAYKSKGWDTYNDGYLKMYCYSLFVWKL